MKVLICGSYKTKEDLETLEKFRERLKKKGIPGVFLMKDIRLIDEKTGDELAISPDEKLYHIWQIMKEGNQIPVFILFAGKSANISLGLNAEIQTISSDKKKISCAHLFKISGVDLVSHEQYFANVKEVSNADEFINEAEKVIDSYLKQAKMFYQLKYRG